MNPYDVLGVPPDATDEEVARAYRRLAKRYHPDLHPDDAAAAERMGRVNRAYDDIKAMRQRGAGPRPGQGYGYGAAWQGPFDPFAYGRQDQYRPRVNPVWAILAVLVMFFVIRLMLSLLFGGFGGGYYFNPGYGVGPGGYYGYQIYPFR